MSKAKVFRINQSELVVLFGNAIYIYIYPGMVLGYFMTRIPYAYNKYSKSLILILADVIAHHATVGLQKVQIYIV